MTVETEVATLTTAVDNLTSAVNVSKATLDAKVVNAQSAETGAIAASGTASGFSTAAAAHKDQAYTYSQSAASAVAYQDLTAIAASKSVTAVDVFVYDTSKDSDGGQWRKRTQGTSWYNETLNTATRGSRKEFPAVAVIVAESGGAAKVTIYDGDDPSMPMWMVFTISNTDNWIAAGNLSSVVALNGDMFFGSTATASGHSGARFVNFIQDVGGHYGSSVENSGLFPTSISGRNAGTSGYAVQDESLPSIISNTINDIAMTVLSNAPIDSATGLPIPTIAVATDGGVSVIKDDGSVVDSSTTVKVYDVQITNDIVWMSLEGGSSFTLRYSDLAGIVDGFTYSSYRVSTNPSGASPHVLGSTSGVVVDDNLFTTRSALGLAKVIHNTTTPSKGSVAYITSDYNTGYQVGDIKGAWLSSTDDTNVVGSELVTNGDGTNITGWTAANGATLTTDGSEFKITSNGATNGLAKTPITCVIGQSYVLEALVRRGTCSTDVRADISGIVDGASTSSTSNVLLSVTFVAVATTHYPEFYFSGTPSSGQTAYFDNMSVRLADTDRSVNANGLAVHGTIGKDPVATGADLVAYSGFSASNYLEQPYNSDLDFGTGDFSVMGWMKTSGAAIEFIIDSRDVSAVEGFTIWRAANDLINFRTVAGSAVSTTTSTTAATDSVWNHICVHRTSSGTVQSIYINGVLDIADTVTARNLTGTDAPMRIGIAFNLTAALTNGSLALFRISATAPSAQQIKDIYEAEKPLFQAGAQATLYGTSDAVTALAHDSDTNLLHVGTSAGRSVFQGLQRVSNTTTAVGSAISASNGLVVEE